jgi:hypothetical protein
MARRSNRSTRQKISNVRVVDSEDGADGVCIDRMITQLQNSHSQIRVLCNTSSTLPVTTTAAVTLFDTAFVRGFDEFASVAAQFDTYRIKAIKVDVYDVNQAVSVSNGASTFHQVYTTQTAPTFSEIADGPDFRIITPGNGKITLHWMAKGVVENEFQATTTTGATDTDFGGVRFYTGAGVATAVKFQYSIKAIVDFRGRR